jgi:carboxypeptidase C (cathepsin A)
MIEIGPFRVKGDHLVENDGSWNEFANLLFGMVDFSGADGS